MKGASLSPTPFIEKQGTSDARVFRRGSANITTVSPYKAELNKKRKVKSTNTVKKLNCPSLFVRDIVSDKRKIAKHDHLPVENVGLLNP